MSALVLRWDSQRKIWLASEGSRKDVLTDGVLIDRLQEYRNTVDAHHIHGFRNKLRYLQQEMKKKYRWDSEQQRIVQVPEE